MRAISLPQNGTPLTAKEQPASRRAVSICSMRAISLPQNGTPLTPKEQPGSRWAVSIRSMKALPALALAASLAVGLSITNPAWATGAMTCDSGDPSGWQSRAALEEKLTGDGWQVRRSKVDGGCYEVYGTTPEGDRVEAYFDPVTLEKLLVSRRGEVLFRASDKDGAG